MFKISYKSRVTGAFLGVVIGSVALTGCSTQSSNQQWPWQQSDYPSNPNNTTQITYNERGVPSHHRVQQGDTVGAIADRYGINYRQIARLNNLDSNYTIYTGQWLKLWDNRNTGNTSYPSNNTNTGNNGSYNNPASQRPDNVYQYPTTNQVIHNFDSASGNYGMWFTGNEGDPILASLGGTVLYSGNGIPEYGNLVMIRHDDNDVTAYAHNKELLVREGDVVRTGQRIATMGRTGNINNVALEFQFRRNGSPIDPRRILNRSVN